MSPQPSPATPKERLFSFLLVFSAVSTLTSSGQWLQGAERLPWDLRTEYRYIWLRENQSVGETRFMIERVSGGERVPSGEQAYLVTTTRRYDHQGNSQRANSTTLVDPGLRPIYFKEELAQGHPNGNSSQLVTTVEVKASRRSTRKASSRWVHNGDTQRGQNTEVALTEDTFLYCSQAVQHWALFVSRLPRGAKSHTLDLFYPDFSKVLKVRFTKIREDTLNVGATRIEATRYDFASPARVLTGRVWVDRTGRLIQIEFPPASLRVILSPKETPPAKRDPKKPEKKRKPSPKE